ncbi:MAG: 50S ribosomal protein L3 [Planctomycetia bacterium]|nr:50S ribosomal protein L3 [Planctomycetia bacterium]
MTIGLLGRKVGMTQIYDEAGQAIPVTVIQVGPCKVLQVRTVPRDGYDAVQLGYLDKPRRLANRSERGHVTKELVSKRGKKRPSGVEVLPKAECEPKRYVREFRCDGSAYQVGQEIKVDEIFKDVKRVDVTATSKGLGYQGVMTRHHFKGQRATHGVKKVHRHGGGTGCNTFPARVFKGKRMAGQHGNAQRTVRNIGLVKVDAENSLLLIHGPVPGPPGGLVAVRATNAVR